MSEREKEIDKLLRALCKCRECPLFGICPKLGHELTEEELEHLRHFYEIV